ncbi:exopolysaccharide biosynthesis protein [Kineobactrum salinum]|uniref:Exopolysaccharide biosynthesis protein n=2 Tax=Kineobactrum salinum TaxID=2708301 RepID=A0A6C0U6D6_9GAMM|nr:exopolysaccharide biosynthesis protein [Kineobactrum salinum]
MIDEELTGLEQLVDRIRDRARSSPTVSIGEILDTIGTRSYGPVMVLAGLITAAPVIGDIPGMPTLMALLVLLTTGPMLFRQEHIWVPRWLAGRSVAGPKLTRALEWSRPAARWLDRLVRPRLAVLVHGPGLYGLVVCSIAIALTMPVLEFIPFSANLAAFGLLACGLAIIARDGVVALLALAFTLSIAVLAVRVLL